MEVRLSTREWEWLCRPGPFPVHGPLPTYYHGGFPNGLHRRAQGGREVLLPRARGPWLLLPAVAACSLHPCLFLKLSPSCCLLSLEAYENRPGTRLRNELSLGAAAGSHPPSPSFTSTVGVSVRGLRFPWRAGPRALWKSRHGRAPGRLANTAGLAGKARRS